MEEVNGKKRRLSEKAKNRICTVSLLLLICTFTGQYFYYYYFVVGTNYITEPQVSFYDKGYKALFVGTDHMLTITEIGVVFHYPNGTDCGGSTLTYVGMYEGKYIYRTDMDHVDFNGETVEIDILMKVQNKIYCKIKVSPTPFCETDSMRVLSFFKAQRCGYTTPNSEMCHSNDIFTVNNVEYNLTGGWHDAGNYDKVSISTAYSLYLLLDTLERTGNLTDFGKELEDEIVHGLNWLIKMQDNSDGGVFNKIETIGEERKLDTNKYTLVSALFSAVLAKSSRLLTHKFDQTMMLNKAIQAWNYSVMNPNIRPESSNYDYLSDSSAIALASAEIFKVNNNTHYYNKSVEIVDIETLPTMDIINELDVFKVLTIHTLYGLNDSFDLLAKAYIKKGYELTKNFTMFGVINSSINIGINGLALNFAMNQIKSFDIYRNKTLLRQALDQFYWVAGNNPLKKSFILGFGTDDYLIKNPYQIQGKMQVGGLVNGPMLNSKMQFVYSDTNSTENGQKNNEATIQNTAVLLWMFSELQNQTRYNTMLLG